MLLREMVVDGSFSSETWHGICTALITTVCLNLLTNGDLFLLQLNCDTAIHRSCYILSNTHINHVVTYCIQHKHSIISLYNLTLTKNSLIELYGETHSSSITYPLHILCTLLFTFSNPYRLKRLLSCIDLRFRFFVQ